MTDEQINAVISAVYGWEADYCSCLNAMHEAEKTLTVDQWHDYVEHVGGTWEQAMHSTARQRAEAFLRTLGKWEEVQS